MQDKDLIIAALIKKHLDGELNAEEQARLDGWLSTNESNRTLYNQLTDKRSLMAAVDSLYRIDKKKGLKRLMEGIKPKAEQVPLVEMESRKGIGWWKYPAAAAVILGLAIGGYAYFKREGDAGQVTAQGSFSKKTTIHPGGDKATLTLADGSTIALDSARNGGLALQGATQISKPQNGQLAYTFSQDHGGRTGEEVASAAIPVLYNSVSTPRGGQYRLILPDGTRVWLNAASSLRFPTAFQGKERNVELKGEAYFEVAKNAAKPFIVMGEGFQVHVLGTNFDVMAYDDEGAVKTTLIQGSVKVMAGESAALLRPGQQAQVWHKSVAGHEAGTNTVKVVSDIDADESLAWKNGYFQFNSADISAVMRQIARWYDVEVVYEGTVTRQHFDGRIQRNLSLSQICESLEGEGLHIKRTGRQITIKP